MYTHKTDFEKLYYLSLNIDFRLDICPTELQNFHNYFVHARFVLLTVSIERSI